MARELVRSARERGTALTGPDGLLKALTKTVIETALDEEMSDHLGYDKHEPVGRNSGNSRNGSRTKTVLTDNCGPVQIEVPRDRAGSFDPAIVKKWQRRSGDVDTIVLSLYAKGSPSADHPDPNPDPEDRTRIRGPACPGSLERSHGGAEGRLVETCPAVVSCLGCAGHDPARAVRSSTARRSVPR